MSDYWIGKYEVTQAEWEAVMGNNPSWFRGANLPVEKVSWYDCIEYCNRLSQREGLPPVYTIDWNLVFDLIIRYGTSFNEYSLSENTSVSDKMQISLSWVQS